MRETFAGRVRAAIEKVTAGGRNEFSTDDLVVEANIKTFKEKKRLSDPLRYMVAKGELERVGRGRYRVPGADRQLDPPKKSEAMWRILRAQKVVTVSDLMQLACVSKDYAKQWLSMLVGRQIARNEAGPGLVGRYRLISDPGPTPPADAEKAAKLRELRRRKIAEAKGELINAQVGIDRAKKILEELEEKGKSSHR